MGSSGHVYPQSFMILNVFIIMFDLVHMQSQSFQMIFQSLMTSYQSVILFFTAQVTGFHLEMGLLFRMILLFNRGEPLSKFFLNAYFGFLFPMRGLAGAQGSSFSR